MTEGKQRRAAGQESIFRNVNESIERGQWPGDESEAVAFRCECARLGCNELLSVTRAEYEQIRSHPRWFVMAAGHELPEVETVIATESGYIVVEKRDAAGEMAEALDPRD